MEEYKSRLPVTWPCGVWPRLRVAPINLRESKEANQNLHPCQIDSLALPLPLWNRLRVAWKHWGCFQFCVPGLQGVPAFGYACSGLLMLALKKSRVLLEKRYTFGNRCKRGWDKAELSLCVDIQRVIP